MKQIAPGAVFSNRASSPLGHPSILNHINECNTELGVASKIHVARGAQRDVLFRKYEQCARDKGNFVDNFFAGDSIHEVMEGMNKELKN